MKKIFVLFILFFTSITAYSFSNRICDSRNCGSVKKIGSETLAVIMYVSYDDEPDISDSKKSNFENKVLEASTWIKNQASKYGKNQNFKCVRCNKGKDFKISRSLGYDIKNMKPRVIAELCFGHNYTNFLENEAKKYNCNSYFLVVCTDKYECSHAYKSYNDLDNTFNGKYLEGCTINLKGEGNLASIIAHEFLHIFGAWDLYGDIYNSNNNTLQYKNKFLKSIMTNTFYTLDEVFIDEVTAYLIGLTDTYYDYFERLCQNGAF